MISKLSGKREASVSKWSCHIPETKCITVYINGDSHFAGLRCVICQQQMKSFTALLNHLTEKLQPNFGAVRTLYDIETGKKVSSLADLVHNQKYAATGVESYRRQEKWFTDSPSKITNVVKRKPKSIIRQKSASASVPSTKRQQKLSADGTMSIYVYKNGENQTPPVKCVLSKSDLLFQNKLLQSISIQLNPNQNYTKNDKANGFRLCSVTGQTLNPEDLRCGSTYVAVENFEIFKRRDYHSAHDFPKSSSSHKTTEEKIGDINKNYLSMDRQRIVAAVGSNKKEEAAEKSVLPHNIEDSTNVFHAKEENILAKGAREVQDSKETVTELPIDLLEPQEVHEEISITQSQDVRRNKDAEYDFEKKNSMVDDYRIDSSSTERIIGIET